MVIYYVCKDCGLPKIPNKYLRCRECFNEMRREIGGLWPDENSDNTSVLEFDTCNREIKDMDKMIKMSD